MKDDQNRRAWRRLNNALVAITCSFMLRPVEWPTEKMGEERE